MYGTCLDTDSNQPTIKKKKKQLGKCEYGLCVIW